MPTPALPAFSHVSGPASAASGSAAASAICGVCLAEMMRCTCSRTRSGPTATASPDDMVDASSSHTAAAAAAATDSTAPPPPPAHVAPRPINNAVRGATRLHCPVVDCPFADPHNHHCWANIATIHNHINSHLAGCHPRLGAVPEAWLQQRGKTRCRGCGLMVAASRGVHPRCHPSVRRAHPPATGGSNNGNDDNDTRVHPGLQPPLAAALPSLRQSYKVTSFFCHRRK